MISALKLWRGAIKGAAVIAALVACYAAMLAYRSAEHGVGAQYVAIAVRVLSSTPKGPPDVALRGWAIDVLNHYSDVKLPSEVIPDLRSGKVTLRGIGFTADAHDTVDGSGRIN